MTAAVGHSGPTRVCWGKDGYYILPTVRNHIISISVFRLVGRRLTGDLNREAILRCSSKAHGIQNIPTKMSQKQDIETPAAIKTEFIIITNIIFGADLIPSRFHNWYLSKKKRK